MSLLGILCWIFELGRVGICLNFSMISYHLDLTWEGNLYQIFQMFRYLKKYHNTEMVYYPINPVIDESSFEFRVWMCSEFGQLQDKEEMPHNVPGP